MITNELIITLDNYNPKVVINAISHGSSLNEDRLKDILAIVLDGMDIAVKFISIFYSQEYAYRAYFETDDNIHGKITWTNHTRKDDVLYFVSGVYFAVAE